MVMEGAVITLMISVISFWLGIQLERNRQKEIKRRYYIRRCRLTDREIKHGFFSDAEPKLF